MGSLCVFASWPIPVIILLFLVVLSIMCMGNGPRCDALRHRCVGKDPHCVAQGKEH